MGMGFPVIALWEGGALVDGWCVTATTTDAEWWCAGAWAAWVVSLVVYFSRSPSLSVCVSFGPLRSSGGKEAKKWDVHGWTCASRGV